MNSLLLFFNKYKIHIFALLVALIGYFTYFQNYQYPAKQFWDENYDIANAQKYLDRVVYLHSHPPLGKLLIALGEKLINPNKNIDKSSFDRTDYIRKFPQNMSFKGFRFFPALFGWLNSILFFYIMLYILKNPLFAFLFTSLYLFDNALIVHFRGAMLDGIQMFFVFSSVLYFLYIYFNSKYSLINYITLSIFIGLAVSTKLNGLILILLYIPIFFYEYKKSFFKAVLKLFFSFVTIIFVFLTIMYIHISIGKKMPTHTTYGMSNEYKQIIKEGKTSSLKYFPIMLRDNIKYMINYHKHVPKYNPCKKGENGSLAYTWPFGNKTINYRWEKHNGKVRYLYLVPNPVIWFLGIIGIFFSTVLVGARLVFDLEIKNKKIFNLIFLFVFIYYSYMFVMANMSRVMYLYHYFIPLEFSLFLFVLIFRYLYFEYIDKNDKILLISLIILAVTIFLAYYYFSPFTYYKPLTYNEFIKRMWFDFWHLQPVR
jgi:dolichyl-phosphate-mannose-protein mannosyltransferase